MKFHGSVNEKLATLEMMSDTVGLNHDRALIDIYEFPIEMAFAIKDKIRGIAIKQDRRDFAQHQRPRDIDAFEKNDFLFTHAIILKQQMTESIKYLTAMTISLLGE